MLSLKCCMLHPFYVISVTAECDCVCLKLQFLVTSPERKVKVKVKFTLEQATKAQRGSRGTALLFL